MAYQNRTSGVVEVPYNPAAAALPVETFTLTSLRQRRGEAELETHQRPQFELVIWCTAGTGRHEVDFESVQLLPGRIIHVGTNQVHRWFLNPSYEARLVLLRPIHHRPTVRSGPRVIDTNPDLETDLHRILDLTGRDLSMRSLEAVRELIVSMLGLDHPDQADIGERAALYRQYERLLSGPEPPPQTVEECASRIGCSTRTLARACHAMVGASPKALLDHAVALEAQRRLSLPNRSITEVAASLGFTELANFTRFFGRVTGQPPSAFVAGLTDPAPGRSIRPGDPAGRR